MNYSISLSKEAQLNIKDALNYYTSISDSLSENISLDLIHAIDDLKQNPFHFQVRYRGIRIAHTKVFPYGIHFIVENKTIYILKILHHKKFYK